ncbi:unnamed protein product [Darwinula stevensoni]|uniref:Uncharacterized protein n=1 Tax=Darwinula stevensoni TaxID=69355 RepID=A0A7R9A9X2_9CRUS|nr:unnamed protein product [Darwinula stevensoni]CAG0897865.1 unnamed protein product [Darwinula stevensoni]
MTAQTDADLSDSIPAQGWLHLRLVWNASNELVLLAQDKGFRTALHHPKAKPDPLGEGFNVGLNVNSYVGVRKMSLERLRLVTGGDCAFDSYVQERFDKRIFKVSDQNKYSKKVVGFIGTLGVLLGLYAGLSFVSVLVVLEWMLDLVLYGWRKPKKKLGRKKMAVITWREPLQLEQTKTEALGSGIPGDGILRNYSPQIEAQRAGFEIVFSDKVML